LALSLAILHTNSSNQKQRNDKQLLRRQQQTFLFRAVNGGTIALHIAVACGCGF